MHSEAALLMRQDVRLSPTLRFIHHSHLPSSITSANPPPTHSPAFIKLQPHQDEANPSGST